MGNLHGLLDYSFWKKEKRCRHKANRHNLKRQNSTAQEIIALGKRSGVSEYGAVAGQALKGKLRLLPQRHCSSACPRGNGRFPQTGLCLDTKQAEKNPVSSLWSSGSSCLVGNTHLSWWLPEDIFP